MPEEALIEFERGAIFSARAVKEFRLWAEIVGLHLFIHLSF